MLPDGVSFPVSPDVSIERPPARLLTSNDVAYVVLAESSSSPSSSSSRLSPRDRAVIATVARFRQVTSRQLQRLFFADGSEISRDPRCRRALGRLVRWGQLTRLPRPVGGYAGGSAGHVYLPPSSKARTPNPHTLDIVELYVELVERHRTGELELLAFEPEPYSHFQVGHTEVKPDAAVRLRVGGRTYRWALEVDLGSEWRTQLGAKMRRYCVAYGKWPDRTFPRVLFVVPDVQRKTFVESVVRRQEEPGLFVVETNTGALATLTQRV